MILNETLEIINEIIDTFNIYNKKFNQNKRLAPVYLPIIYSPITYDTFCYYNISKLFI